jgi:hypothetical protein
MGSQGPGSGRRRLDRPPRVRHSARVAENGRDWKRLGLHVVQARVEAGWTKRPPFVAAIARATGEPITSRTIGNLERGTAVSAATLAAVELALGWAPGSCEAILRGGEAIKKADRPAAQPKPADDNDEFRQSLRVMRRAMGHDAFMRWIDEASKDAEGDETG